MTNKELEEMVAALRIKQDELILKKGHDYTIGNADRLFNFKWVAGIVGVTSKQVAMVYLMKHILAIATAVQFGHNASAESLESRILDASNYLLLLKGLFDDDVLPSDSRTEKDIPLNYPAQCLQCGRSHLDNSIRCLPF